MAREYTVQRVLNCSPDIAYSYCLSALEGAGMHIQAHDANLGAIVAYSPPPGCLTGTSYSFGVEIQTVVMPTEAGQTVITVKGKSERHLGIPSLMELFGNEAQKTIVKFLPVLDLILQRRGVEYQDV